MSRILERRSETLARPGTLLYEWITGGGQTASGQAVNEETALRLPIVYACINVVATDVATIPLHIYRREQSGRSRADNHPLYTALNVRANPEMSAVYFRQVMMGHVLGWGNAYALVLRAPNRRVELWPLHPGRMRVERVSGELRYRYSSRSGDREFRKNEIFHLRAFGHDGVMGISPIRQQREAIGFALAAQEYGAKFYANDARPSVVLRHPKRLTEEAHQRLRESWNKSYAGSGNAWRTAIVEEGVEIETIGIHPEDAEFIATRRFQNLDICRIYRVPPHKVMDLERATYSNIEEQAISYVTDTIRPWCALWEAELLIQLFEEREWGTYYPEFLIDDLQRGDIVRRTQSYALGVQWGWLSPNEVRAKENMNPAPGGDVYLMPINYQERVQTRAARGYRSSDRKSQVSARLHLGEAYRKVFADAAGRLIRREAKEVMGQAKKLLSRSDNEFDAWLESYYRDEFLRNYGSIMSPAFYSYAESVQALAAEEVGAPIGMTPGLEECVKQHLDNTARYHAQMSVAQIRANLNVESTDGLAALFAAWEAGRAGKIAAWESTRMSGLISKATWFYAGVPEIEWVETDGNHWCRQLDGARVKIGASCRSDPFLHKTDTLKRSGDEFSPAWNVSTPPLWLGCTCQIIPKI